VVGLLLLPAVSERLAEDPVLVAQAIAHRGELEHRHGVQEARSQSAQSAVAETGIGLLLYGPEPVQLLLVGEPREMRLEH